MGDAWLSGLGAPAVWAGRSRFTLLDTDFDQGLKFLMVWDAWRQDPCRSERLHVVGLLPQLPAQPGARIPARLQGLAQQLIAAWPLNMPGLHRLEFEGGGVTLTLGVGPVPVVMGRLCARVDAFFLCEAGLPAATEQTPGAMDALAHAVRALASADARLVMQAGQSAWRAPLTRLGVPVQPDQPVKRSGQTEQLVCTTLSGLLPQPVDPWRQEPASPETRHALVVGAGFAGMAVAHALALRGWRVTVLDAQWGDEQSTHLQHAAAALTPMLARDDNIRGRLSRAGSLRAQHRWGHLPESVLLRCGALQLQREQGRVVDLAGVVKALGFPTQWTQYVSAKEASDIAGLNLARGGIYFPTAARVDPQALLNMLACTPGVVILRAEVSQIRRQGQQWQALGQDGQILEHAPFVVLAGGFDTRAILSRSGLLAPHSRLAAMHALGGEITLVPDAMLAGGPRCIVGGDGYLLPSLKGYCVAGSSYLHGAEAVAVTQAGIEGNLKRVAGLLNQPDIHARLAGKELTGWAGWRAVLPGRLPAMGPVGQEQGLWVATGFASRGLTWATLAGDLIAGALNGEPIVLEKDIIEGVGGI